MTTDYAVEIGFRAKVHDRSKREGNFLFRFHYWYWSCDEGEIG